MQGNFTFNQLDFLNNWRDNEDYFQMLAMVASLSRLFSENATPYIDYRLVENLFCKYYKAENDARLCTAFDARIISIGIGIKTFILSGAHKFEKIAEFNQLRGELDGLQGVTLARKLAEFRNERISFSVRQYGIEQCLYHIVGRRKGELEIFNTPYDYIDIDNIHNVKSKKNGSLAFEDGKNYYSFNNSKTVLLKKFQPSSNPVHIPVRILDDPLELLAKVLNNDSDINSTVFTTSNYFPKKGLDYVILPLYSTLRRNRKTVPEKSGLNQWNARGRSRDPNEVYIPIPIRIHKLYPDFFPSRDTPFKLYLPDGKVLSAKICQENGKALMSNPNAELGKWILRKALKIKEGDLVTMQTLNLYGIDSIMVRRSPDLENGERVYHLFFSNEKYESYEQFISEDDF